jgi:hypothetical protein
MIRNYDLQQSSMDGHIKQQNVAAYGRIWLLWLFLGLLDYISDKK